MYLGGGEASKVGVLGDSSGAEIAGGSLIVYSLYLGGGEASKVGVLGDGSGAEIAGGSLIVYSLYLGGGEASKVGVLGDGSGAEIAGLVAHDLPRVAFQVRYMITVQQLVITITNKINDYFLSFPCSI